MALVTAGALAAVGNPALAPLPAARAQTTAYYSTDAAPQTLIAQQLDTVTARIALYPDPLLAQVLAAATFPDQIGPADDWAYQHRNLTGDALAQAMQSANLPWDPSIQALIPFPTVLDMMNRDPDWVALLGNAVLAQRGDVMDSVQRMRKRAYDVGNLKSNDKQKVVVQSGTPQVIVLEPANPDVIYVPAYDPAVVYYQPVVYSSSSSSSAVLAAGIFGFLAGVVLTSALRDSCWGFYTGFGWPGHTLILFNTAWGRTWRNRRVYVHPWGGWNVGFYSRPGSYINRPFAPLPRPRPPQPFPNRPGSSPPTGLRPPSGGGNRPSTGGGGNRPGAGAGGQRPPSTGGGGANRPGTGGGQTPGGGGQQRPPTTGGGGQQRPPTTGGGGQQPGGGAGQRPPSGGGGQTPGGGGGVNRPPSGGGGQIPGGNQQRPNVPTPVTPTRPVTTQPVTPTRPVTPAQPRTTVPQTPRTTAPSNPGGGRTSGGGFPTTAPNRGYSMPTPSGGVFGGATSGGSSGGGAAAARGREARGGMGGRR